MLNPFFFQNHLTRRPPGTVVIDFLNTNGSVQLVYKKDSLYVPAEPKDLLKASIIRINYGYLGGEHFCNYIMSRSGNQFTFTLNKAMLESGDYVWDINHAAFLVSQDGDSVSNGLSPIYQMVFEITDDQFRIVSLETFRDRAIRAGLDYPVTWHVGTTAQDPTKFYYYNKGNINITFDIFKNWGLGLTTETPALLNFRMDSVSGTYFPLAFTYYAPELGQQILEIVVQYPGAFRINPITSTLPRRVAWMANDGSLNGPSPSIAEYRNFIP